MLLTTAARIELFRFSYNRLTSFSPINILLLSCCSPLSILISKQGVSHMRLAHGAHEVGTWGCTGYVAIAYDDTSIKF